MTESTTLMTEPAFHTTIQQSRLFEHDALMVIESLIYMPILVNSHCRYRLDLGLVVAAATIIDC